MSVGNAVGAAVGAVIGFYMGGPAGALKGAQLGMTLGGIVDPPKGPSVNGPRLTDLTLQSSSYNSVIPRVYGTVALTGNIIWLENNQLKEVVSTSKSGGKGGGGGSEVTTYSYYATFAVALCKGPITAVRRIWIGPNLVYDAGTGNKESVIASNECASIFTLHNGTETQLPDDRMQATLGVSNTPAYRGLAYIVFKDLSLKPYGNTLQGSQVKVEVIMSGSVIVSEVAGDATIGGGQYQLMAAHSSFGGVAISKYPFPTDRYLFTTDAVNWTERTFPSSRKWSVVGAKSDQICALYSYDGIYSTKDGNTWIYSPLEYLGWSVIAWNGEVWCIGGNGKISFSTDAITWTSVTVTGMPNAPTCIVAHGKRFIISYEGSNQYITSDDNGFSWVQRTLPLSANDGFSGIASNGTTVVGVVKSTAYISRSYDGGNTWSAPAIALPGHLDTVSKGITYGLGVFCIVGYSGTYDGELIFSSDGISWYNFTVDAMYHSTFFSNDTLSFTGYSFAGIPTNGGTACFSVVPGIVQSNSQTLGGIVLEECIKTELLSPLDVDVSLLTQPIRGYRIGRLSSLKTALEPLQAAYPFDIIQSGYKIKFKPRGSTSVATIPVSDLGSTQGE